MLIVQGREFASERTKMFADDFLNRLCHTEQVTREFMARIVERWPMGTSNPVFPQELRDMRVSPIPIPILQYDKSPDAVTIMVICVCSLVAPATEESERTVYGRVMEVLQPILDRILQEVEAPPDIRLTLEVRWQ